MSTDPQDFFEKYVLAPYAEWIADELCEWKAFAVVGGLNALVEHAFRHANPSGQIGTPGYQQQLGAFRKSLSNATDHDHIRFVAEVFKHVELNPKKQKTPGKFEPRINKAGSFNSDFNNDFDVFRPQLGFMYKEDQSAPATWLPLHRVTEQCIDSWKHYFRYP